MPYQVFCWSLFPESANWGSFKLKTVPSSDYGMTIFCHHHHHHSHQHYHNHHLIIIIFIISSWPTGEGCQVKEVRITHNMQSLSLSLDLPMSHLTVSQWMRQHDYHHHHHHNRHDLIITDSPPSPSLSMSHATVRQSMHRWKNLQTPQTCLWYISHCLCFFSCQSG